MSVRIFGRLTRHVGVSAPLRPGLVWWIALVLYALACPNHAKGQAPNAIVTVRLEGVGAAEVEAVLTADSTLLLPAPDVEQLLGLPSSGAAWLTVAQLRQMFPPIQVTWEPRALLVLIRDDLLVLPASRSTRDAIARQAQGAAPYQLTTSGPFLAVTANDAGRQLYEGGYSYRGKVALTAARSTTRGDAWTLSLMPSPVVFASVGEVNRLPAASARIALGPAWTSVSWTRGQAVAVDALVQLHRVAFFASPTRDAYAVTVNVRPLGLQLGRSGNHNTAKLTYGALPPNPFAVPMVP